MKRRFLYVNSPPPELKTRDNVRAKVRVRNRIRINARVMFRVWVRIKVRVSVNNNNLGAGELTDKYRIGLQVQIGFGLTLKISFDKRYMLLNVDEPKCTRRILPTSVLCCRMFIKI